MALRFTIQAYGVTMGKNQAEARNFSATKKGLQPLKTVERNRGKVHCSYMGVSKNNGIPKSSILIGFSHFGGTPIFGNIHMMTTCDMSTGQKFRMHRLDSGGLHVGEPCTKH